MSLLDRLPGRQPYVRATTDRELTVNRPYRTDGYTLSEPDTTPTSEPDTEPVCTCKVFDAIGQNPECPEHPWWAHDTDVLHLADLTRELGSAWAAAQAKFGGGS